MSQEQISLICLLDYKTIMKLCNTGKSMSKDDSFMHFSNFTIWFVPRWTRTIHRKQFFLQIRNTNLYSGKVTEQWIDKVNIIRATYTNMWGGWITKKTINKITLSIECCYNTLILSGKSYNKDISTVSTGGTRGKKWSKMTPRGDPIYNYTLCFCTLFVRNVSALCTKCVL
jgi:hypothetical protein